MHHPHLNNNIKRIPAQKAKDVTDDKTIIAILLPPVPAFFLLGTSIPKGFSGILPFPSLGYKSPYMLAAAECAAGGEDGRPASCGT